ncbi:UNVERIFIED_CONTAM: hypothetical protein FKN15_020603 [Acipenser sinensis]
MGDSLKDKLSQEACIKTLCCCCLQFDSCKSPADLESGAAAGARRKRRKRQPQIRRPAPLKEAVRSLGGFFFGLVLSSCYAGMVLFVHSYGMWYSLLSTVTIAAFCSFGMGLSVRIRSNVFLMLPMICSTVLNKIKNISKNAKVVADKVRRFLKSLMSSVKHVARILRNVLHFLVNIGEICNDQLGSPYRKCIKIFDDARADCLDVMSFFGFLCYIVDIFKPLCGLAYRGRVLQEDRLMDDYDNNYITNEFVEMDIMRAQHDKSTVLPLSQDEALKYVRPCSLYMTGRERRTYIWNIANVFRHMLICSLVVVIDYIIFWIFDMVRYYLQGEIIARAPVQIAIDINGSGYAADIYKDIVASFDVLQQANISVLSKKCRMNPAEPDYMGYLIIGLYCTQCFKKLNNVCTICMSPLTFEDDNEEELDSSDEEKVKLWISAMKAMKNMELEKKRELRKLLKRRIKEALRKKVDKGGQGLPKELRKRTAAKHGEERSESDTSSNISSQSSDSNSDLDFNYQDKSESEHTLSSEDDPEAFLEKRKQRVQMSRRELSDSSEDSSDSQAEERGRKTKGSENTPEEPVREEPPAAPEETPPGDDFLASLNRAKTGLQETAPSAAPDEPEDDLMAALMKARTTMEEKPTATVPPPVQEATVPPAQEDFAAAIQRARAAMK